MGFLHAPIRKRQPRDPVARGNSLRHAWTPFVGGYGPGGLGLFDAAPIHAHGVMGTGSPTTTTGTYHCATRFGQAIRFDDSGTGTTASKRLPLGNTSGNGAPSGSIFTIHALVAVGSIANNNAIYATNSSNGGIRFGVDTSAKLTLIKPGTAVMGSSTGTLTAGQFYSVGVTYDGATVSFYINGQQSGTASSSQTFTHEQANAGSDVTDSSWNITNSSYLVLLDVWDRALTPRQMFERFSDPWSIYTQPGRIYINAAAAGGTTISPASGALTLTGQAPTVSATQNHWTQPGSGALTITGFAPTVTVPSNVVAKPTAGALTITGHAPNRVVDTALKPSSGSLTITGHAPTVSITANQTVQPSSGALTLTGQAPTVTVTQNVFSNPLTGALVINGFAPTATVASQSPTISPATASLILQAFAPAVTVTGQTERALGGSGKRYPVGNLDLATWRKTRRLEARVEKLQKQIQEKRDRIDRTESFRQIEALKKQIAKLQKIILELLAQIDMLRKEDDEVEEVINVVRAVMAYRMRQ